MAFLETLESRLFMSVTPAQVAAADKVIKTAESHVSAGLKHLERQGLTDFAVIVAAVKHLGKAALRSEKSLGAAFEGAGAELVSTLEKGESTGAALVNKDITALVAAEKKLAKSPTNATLLADVSADNTKLTNDASTVLADLSADANTTAVDSDLGAIASANSTDATIGTDVSTAETDITNNLNTAGTVAQTLYTSDVTAVQNLFGG